MKKIFSLVLSLFIAFNINAGDRLTASITGCVPCISNSKTDIKGQQFKTLYGYWTLRRNDIGAPYGWGLLFRQDYVSGEAYIGKPHIRHMLKEIDRFKE